MASERQHMLEVLGAYRWADLKSVPPARWICGHCGSKVSSDRGWVSTPEGSAKVTAESPYVRICSGCQAPTLFVRHVSPFPGEVPGGEVKNLPEDVGALYYEARQGATVRAYTAAVLVCRKILMHIAVERGADEGNTFLSYVEHLKKTGYVPPGGDVWVDYIRKRGNEANHEIKVMAKEDALALITLVEMLLRIVYEFPSMVPGAGDEDASAQADVVT